MCEPPVGTQRWRGGRAAAGRRGWAAVAPSPATLSAGLSGPERRPEEQEAHTSPGGRLPGPAPETRAALPALQPHRLRPRGSDRLRSAWRAGTRRTELGADAAGPGKPRSRVNAAHLPIVQLGLRGRCHIERPAGRGAPSFLSCFPFCLHSMPLCCAPAAHPLQLRFFSPGPEYVRLLQKKILPISG